MAERFHTLYPDYDVLEKWSSPSWNDATREVINERLNQVPLRRFFSQEQWATLVAVASRVMPQPERTDPVPIVPWIDERLHKGRGTGTRYASLPPEPECWRRGADAIESEAQYRYRRSFERLDPVEQDLILRAIDQCEVRSPAWEGLPSRLFMRHVLLREMVEVYYAHPAAWSEIGFGGPASPRGYVRLAANRRDTWEGEEVPNALTDELVHR